MLFSLSILWARNAAEHCPWLDVRNPGHSGITCCCCDIAWCCLLTCSTTEFQVLVKECTHTGDVIFLSHYSWQSPIVLFVLRTSTTWSAIWMGHWGILKADGNLYVCLKFLKQNSWVFSLHLSFHYQVVLLLDFKIPSLNFLNRKWELFVPIPWVCA